MGHDSRVNLDYKRLKTEARTNKLIYNQCEPCEERREREKKKEGKKVIHSTTM